MHDVDVSSAIQKVAAGTKAEGERFWKSGAAHVGELQDVDPVAKLVRARHPERVFGPIKVEARQAGEAHTGIDIGIGLPADHLDVVSQRHQLPGKMAHVDALAARVGIAAVGQQRHAQAPRRRRHEA